MSNLLAELKSRRKSSIDRFAQIKSQAEQQNTSKFEKEADTRYWRPEVDKVGNAYAVIRFLDAPKGEDSPWVRIWNHAFKNDKNGRWYIENSLTTLGQNDPVSELNSELWNSGPEENKNIARKQRRNLRYISNVLVISDPTHPENEGKNFLFRYGSTIFNQIKNKMVPPEAFKDEQPINPFDFWEGANFKLKMRRKDGYPNYDLSSFAEASAISDDDNQIQEIWSNCYSLSDEVAPSKFKSYDELKKHLEWVLKAKGERVGSVEEEFSSNNHDQERAVEYNPTPKKLAPTKLVEVEEESTTVVVEEDDEENEFKDLFSSLKEKESDERVTGLDRDAKVKPAKKPVVTDDDAPF